MKRYKLELTILVIFLFTLSLLGCSSPASEGSLASMHREMLLQQYKGCKNYFREQRKRGVVLIPNEEVCFTILGRKR